MPELQRVIRVTYVKGRARKSKIWTGNISATIGEESEGARLEQRRRSRTICGGAGGTLETALAEIKRGAKRSHWMWYIFPQIAGLGSSDMARLYAIRSLDEARAFLEHPLLGPRLRTCVEALQDLPPTTAETVFGGIDAVKLRSSLTLFIAAGGGTIFIAALKRWFDGVPDEATLQRLPT